MSPGLPGLAISYLLYAVLGLAKFFNASGTTVLPTRVFVSSAIALSGLLAMVSLAWWSKVDIPLAFILTQPLLLLTVLGILALVRKYIKRSDAQSAMAYTDRSRIRRRDPV